MTCTQCGRDEGHHLGCPQIGMPVAAPLAHDPDPEDPNKTPDGEFNLDGEILINPTDEEREQAEENNQLQNAPDEELEPETTGGRVCVFGHCQNEVTGDKRVKYCEDHRDVKSRKE